MYDGNKYVTGEPFILRSDMGFTAAWEADISLSITIGSQSEKEGLFKLTASVTGAHEES